MTWKRRIAIIVLYPLVFASGFFVGLYYGGFMTGLSTTSIVSFFAVFGVSDALWVIVLLKEILDGRKEEKKERHREWKRRVLTAYEAYITSLNSMLFTGNAIDDHGWPDVHHKKEAEAFLSDRDFYKVWKNCVESWNGYVKSPPPRTEMREELNARYRQKIIDELSKSGIPNKQADSVLNKNYVDYEYFAKRIVECWTIGDTFTTSVGRVRQFQQADSPDDQELQQLVGKIDVLTPSLPQKAPLRIEYENAVEKMNNEMDNQDKIRKNNWIALSKGREAFLTSLKEFSDDVDADRIGQGAM